MVKKRKLKKLKNLHNPAQTVILMVIILASITVVVTLLYVAKFDTKQQTEYQISNLVKYYYEEYFYPNLSSGTGTVEDGLAKYAEDGLAPVTLRQLILNYPQMNEIEASRLSSYCNENATNVTFYPEAPYGKEDYRAEISYSCNF